MAKIKDLNQCLYLPVTSENLLAVGFLEDYDFNKGSVDIEFYEKLEELMKRAWNPYVSLGFYHCKLCQFSGESGDSYVLVPYSGKIYVAPELIVHYINVHWYKPPDIFIEAVMNCPEMRSMDYKKSILKNGGRIFVNQ